MIKKLFALLLAGMLALSMAPARADPLTVIAVSKALQDALKSLQDSLVTAGGEMKGVGNAWQQNAQNVLADIDKMLGGKMTTVIDQLDKTERKLVSDAQQLTGLMQQATKQVATHSFREARTTLNETDILAYNTSFSLPCRDQVPRIVYWTPTKATVVGGEVVVNAKGNFLNVDKGVKVTVNGVAAPVIGQTDRDLVFKLPASVLEAVKDEGTVGIEVSGLAKRERKSGLLAALFGCSEKVATAANQKLTVTLRPRVVYNINATMDATSKIWSAPYEAYRTNPKFYRATGAGGNEEVSQQYCLKTDEVVVSADLQITDTGGPSTAGPWQLSGDRCVLVPARVVGNGFDNILGAKVSRGGGNIGYILVITGKRLHVVSIQQQQFQHVARNGENVVSFLYVDPPSDNELKWKYNVHIKSTRGNQILFDDTLTEVTPGSPSGVSVNFNDGTMSVTLPGEQPWTEM